MASLSFKNKKIVLLILSLAIVVFYFASRPSDQKIIDSIIDQGCEHVTFAVTPHPLDLLKRSRLVIKLFSSDVVFRYSKQHFNDDQSVSDQETERKVIELVGEKKLSEHFTAALAQMRSIKTKAVDRKIEVVDGAAEVLLTLIVEGQVKSSSEKFYDGQELKLKFRKTDQGWLISHVEPIEVVGDLR